MAAEPVPASTTRVAIWEDFVDIFFAPSSVFRRREQGNVLVPILVVTLLTGVIFYLNSGALRPLLDAEFDRQMAAVMRSNPKIPPQAIDGMRSFSSRAAQVGVFVSMPIMMICVGLVTWLAGKLVEAKQSLHAALVVAAYSFTPRVLEGVVNGIQALILDPAEMNGRFRITLGPGRFLDPDTASPLLIAFAGRLDLFTLWITALIAIGLCVTGRIPLRRAGFAAAIVWVVGGLPTVLQALRTL